jgi:glutathione synthase
MKILFVADPLESFKIHKDTTFAMMREAARRGYELFACEAAHLYWAQNNGVAAHVRCITILNPTAPTVPAAQGAWFSAKSQVLKLRDVNTVLMRTDPPFNTEYFYATHLLGQAQKEGIQVLNHPQALRDHPEKLAILEFEQFIAPTLVSRCAADLKHFHMQQQDIIFKPLDGMGGTGIFRVGPDGLNLGSIIESLNQDGQTSVMVQRYLPEITQGDKRILLINGQVVPHVLARIPQGSEIRGNMAVGGIGVAQTLSARDLEIAHHLGPILAARGLFLVGLDIIGDHLTEINVTSPTGFQEITTQTGFDVAAMFLNALEET